MLPVGRIRDKVLAAHRCGLTHVILPDRNRRQVDEDLGDDLPHALEVHNLTGMDSLPDLTPGRTPTRRSLCPRRACARSPRR